MQCPYINMATKLTRLQLLHIRWQPSRCYSAISITLPNDQVGILDEFMTNERPPDEFMAREEASRLDQEANDLISQADKTLAEGDTESADKVMQIAFALKKRVADHISNRKAIITRKIESSQGSIADTDSGGLLEPSLDCLLTRLASNLPDDAIARWCHALDLNLTEYLVLRRSGIHTLKNLWSLSKDDLIRVLGSHKGSQLDMIRPLT